MCWSGICPVKWQWRDSSSQPPTTISEARALTTAPPRQDRDGWDFRPHLCTCRLSWARRQGGSPQYWIFTSEQGRSILFLWNLNTRAGFELFRQAALSLHQGPRLHLTKMLLDKKKIKRFKYFSVKFLKEDASLNNIYTSQYLYLQF